jgi:hypothetical protein
MTSYLNDTMKYNQLLSEATQRKIWKVARVDASLYTMNRASSTVYGPWTGRYTNKSNGMHWNQSSDRMDPSSSWSYIPRRRTSLRPGGTSPAGTTAKGVDIKHNSYHRYLARKKAPVLATSSRDPLPTPIQGNKSYVLGFSTNCYCT